MKNIFSPSRYLLMTFRLEQLWLPAGLLALAMLLTALFQWDQRSIETVRIFLGIILPLMSGILAPYSLLDNQAIELYFSTPRSAALSLIERLGFILVVISLAAAIFQCFCFAIGFDLTYLGPLARRQLAWLVPSLFMLSLSSLIALATAKITPGVMMAGFILLLQAITHTTFETNPILNAVYLFQGSSGSLTPALILNQVCLTGLAILFLGISHILFQNQERYL